MLFIFIKNFRLAEFSLFVTGLKEIIIFVLLLDHTQYTRWRSISFKYLIKTTPKYVNIYFFSKGYLTMQKNDWKISKVGIDQAQGKESMLIKIELFKNRNLNQNAWGEKHKNLFWNSLSLHK